VKAAWVCSSSKYFVVPFCDVSSSGELCDLMGSSSSKQVDGASDFAGNKVFTLRNVLLCCSDLWHYHSGCRIGFSVIRIRNFNGVCFFSLEV
jgi:hypothetical protein